MVVKKEGEGDEGVGVPGDVVITVAVPSRKEARVKIKGTWEYRREK
jgi:hypothetical protein